MSDHANKTQENKSQSKSSADSQNENDSKPTFQFVSNRPEDITQSKLQEVANNSPQVKQAAQFTAMANNRYVPLQPTVIQGKFATIQLQEGMEEEELLQGKFEPFQRQGMEEEELLQGKFAPFQRQGIEEEELLQGKFEPFQRQGIEEEELLQGKFEPFQRKGMEEEELLQGKFEPFQRQEMEEEELLQGKFEPFQRQEMEEEELLQGKFEPIQRQGMEEEDLLQGKFEPIQRKGMEEEDLLQGKFEPVQRKENNTGLPDNLKTGMESLSGMSLDDVKVHRNSDKPAQLQAHAYAQGTDIHLGSGQEKHLPHEAWHVVQQKQGRVKPTMQMKGKVNVNDDAGLEKEADVMGEKAIGLSQNTFQLKGTHERGCSCSSCGSSSIQMKNKFNVNDDAGLEKEADVMGEKAVGLSQNTFQLKSAHEKGCSCSSCGSSSIQMKSSERYSFVGAAPIQAKLDKSKFSRSEFKSENLKSVWQWSGHDAFKDILKHLDKYHKAKTVIEEESQLKLIISNIDKWVNYIDNFTSNDVNIKNKRNRIWELRANSEDELAAISLSDKNITQNEDAHISQGLEADMTRAMVTKPDMPGIEETNGADKGERTNKELADTYNTMDPSMGKYARRTTNKKEDYFEDRENLNIKNRALSMPRKEDGSLSEEAVSLLTQMNISDAINYTTNASAITASPQNSMKKGDAMNLIAGDTNKATKFTQRPDLLNLTSGVTDEDKDKEIMDTLTFEGISLKVNHSKIDINYRPRLSSFLAAVKIIKNKGFNLPANLIVNLPKYGRKDIPSSMCTANGGPRAVFNAPNFVYLRGDIVNNPIDSTVGENFKNLSTKLEIEGEPTGVPSIVHELGHMLHYTQSPAKFFGLDMASHNTGVAQEVSGYATNNPREFVAEVFLGKIYGQTFSDKVQETYKAFGGPE
jgi:hypothetical protein